MASKAKAAKTQINEKQNKKSTRQYEGALDNSYYVNALMKNDQWHKALIIDCRLIKEFASKRKKNDSCYEYYIHYEGVNRRMDEWVIRSRLELTDKVVEDEPELKKKKKTNNDDHKQSHGNEENDEHEGMDQASLRAHEEATKFKTISNIQIGQNRTDTWYYSPYPQGYHNIDCLYICEFCLSFYVREEESKIHIDKCPLTHPPGDEIYRYGVNSIFEVDGSKNPTYCENICLISKLFLDHKNLFYDVEPFLFFVLTENDDNGSHVVGYFSKEKESSQSYNLSCIMILPFHQRKGYGKFLITFSYELSLKEGKIGTPERPLSDLGRESYLSWWIQRIIQFIQDNYGQPFSINDCTKETGIREQDIIWTLEQKQLVKYNLGQILICVDSKVLQTVYKQAGRAGIPVYPERIHWYPFKFKYEQQTKAKI